MRLPYLLLLASCGSAPAPAEPPTAGTEAGPTGAESAAEEEPAAAANGHKTDCRRLIVVINENIRRIKSAALVDDEVSDGFRALADGADGAAREIRAIEVSSPVLRRLATDYLAMLDDTATAARGIALAIDTSDAAGLLEHRARLDHAVDREDPVVDAINDWCD